MKFMLSEKEKEDILNEEKEKRDRQRYAQLKAVVSTIQHVENGNLIPNNQKEYDDVKREIKQLEKEHPHFNFLKD